MGKQTEWLSGRQLAERICCDEKAVRKARVKNLLDDCYNAELKKYNWDLAQGNTWVLQQLTHIPKAGVSVEKAVEKLTKTAEKKTATKKGVKKNETTKTSPQQIPGNEAPAIIDDVDELDRLIANLKINENLSIAEALKAKQILSAALDKVELMKERRTLVKRVDVDKALFAYGAELKKSLQALPAKIIDDVRAAPNKVDALNIMQMSMNEILKNYSEGTPLNNL